MYIDAHAHLDFFGEKIDAAIDEINRYKIITIANSMDTESYSYNKEYAKKSEYIKPCFGIHPSKAFDFKGDLNELMPYINETDIIGEIGLDFFWVEDQETYERQREVFNFILNEAIKLNKIATIHTKGAEEEVYETLKSLNYNNVIIHWYSGDLKILDKFIELGCYFTVSVDLGYSKLTAEVLERVPLDKLLLETDGPTALEWVNGEYGNPKVIIDLYEKVAKYKNLEVNEIKDIIFRNYKELLLFDKRYI